MSFIVIAFADLYWVFESFLYTVIWRKGSLIEQLFISDHEERRYEVSS